MKRGTRKSALYVGADDSNNHDLECPRVLVATFSSRHEDSIYRYFPRRRDLKSFQNWQSRDSSRGFRFTLLSKSDFGAMQPILPLVIPRLVADYILTLEDIPEKIWICLDGILPRNHRQYIRETLKSDFSEIVVNNVVKRRRTMARRPREEKLYCPLILKMADICANNIYNKLSENNLLDGMVDISQYFLKNLYSQLR